MKRRRFLGVIVGLSVFSVIARYFAIDKKRHVNPFLDSLAAFLDTLIPKDETPGASELGVHSEIVQHAQNITNYTKLLELGCQWLDVNARALGFNDFISLPQLDKDTIVAKAERAQEMSIEKIFFDRVYLDAFRFYYAKPASWTSLGLFAPPQPLGYPDYDKPPLQS